MPSFARSNLNSATRCDESAGHIGRSADSLRARLPARLLLAVLRGYQVLLSPLFAGSCRYVPSCSKYMAEAVRRHGASRGFWLGLRRLGRCHPLGSSGFDPVPDNHPGSEHDNHSGSDFPVHVPGAHAPSECPR